MTYIHTSTSDFLIKYLCLAMIHALNKFIVVSFISPLLLKKGYTYIIKSIHPDRQIESSKTSSAVEQFGDARMVSQVR